MYKDDYFNFINDLMIYAMDQIKYNISEIPVYSILFDNYKNIIDESNNINEHHAEMIILSKLNYKHYYNNLNILVTLQPCMMCMYKIYYSKINNLYFGAFNEKYNNITNFNNKINIFGGFFKKNNEILLKNFFKNKR